MNQYGKWDDSSASTQASPNDIYQSYDRRPRPKARQAPTSLLAYKGNLSRSSTLLPLGVGGKWCLPGQIIVDDQDETDVMMQDVMDGVTPDLSREAMAPQPDSVYQAANPFTNPSKDDLIMSPASRRPREHFRGCISPISVTEASLRALGMISSKPHLIRSSRERFLCIAPKVVPYLDGPTKPPTFS